MWCAIRNLLLTQLFFRDHSFILLALFLFLSGLRTHAASKAKAREALQQINIFHSHLSENKKSQIKKGNKKERDGRHCKAIPSFVKINDQSRGLSFGN